MVALIWLVLGIVVLVFAFLALQWAMVGVYDYFVALRHVENHRALPKARSTDMPMARTWESIFPNE